jgi:hypothetical protein
MDPVSVCSTALSAIKAVFGVSTTLYAFVQDTKQVDHALAAFFAETTNLKTSITAIESGLKNPLLLQFTQSTAPDDQIYELCISIDDALQDCRRTCDELDIVLRGIRGTHNDPRNPFRQALKAVKLNMDSESIVQLRAQINSHTSAMQLALQMINV